MDSDELERKIKDAFLDIKMARGKLGEKDFRNLLESLNAQSKLIKDVSQIVRSFDEDSETFGNPYQRIMAIIGDDPERREMFLKSARDFESGRRGFGGGFNEFAQELRQERNEIAALLKKYNKLHVKRLRLSEADNKVYRQIDYSMPSSIRELVVNIRANSEGKFRPRYKEIATKWMVQYYPCTEKTLVQITRQASKKIIHRKREWRKGHTKY